MKFQWDPRKAIANMHKHGIRFEEALTVFQDPLALIFDDMAHAELEHREIIIGHSVLNHLILVCFTERDQQSIRIFSSRRATKREQIDYEENARTQIS
jgi:uncharacterized protein